MIKWIVLLLGIWSQFAIADELLSKNEFADRYIESALEKIEGFEAIKSGELEVTFEGDNGEERVSFLHNAYAAYISEPESLEQIIHQYSDSLSEGGVPTDTIASFTDNIFPVIKNKAYITQVGKMMKERSVENQLPFYFEKLNSDLFVLYVIDTPTSMTFVSEAALDEKGIDKKDLRKIAKTNLQNSVKLKLRGDSSSLSMLVADGIYEASFILFETIWNKDVFPVKGDIVIYLPSRDVVLVTGSEDAEGLEEVQSIIHNPNAEWPYMITNKGFVRTINGWEPFNK